MPEAQPVSGGAAPAEIPAKAGDVVVSAAAEEPSDYERLYDEPIVAAMRKLLTTVHLETGAGQVVPGLASGLASGHPATGRAADESADV